jgi:anti-sigma factor ChrR (cupin superfamily)
MDLSQIPLRPTRHPGVSIHFFHVDSTTGHAAVLIRMEPGASYPRHRHRGAEELFLLSGGFRDEHGEHRAPGYARFEDGSSHAPVALEGGAPCIFFAIAGEGIDLL